MKEQRSKISSRGATPAFRLAKMFSGQWSSYILHFLFIFFFSLLLTAYCLLPTAYYLLPPANAAQTTDYSKVGMGARVLGMGRSFVGLADDANSIFINPAGISQVSFPSLTSVFTNLGGEVNYSVLGFTAPTRIGPIGIGYLSSGISDLYTTQVGTDGIISTVSTFNYSSSLLLLSYGKEFNTKLLSGISLKFFNKAFTNLSGGSGSGFNIDLGLLYKPRGSINLGLSLQNFFSSSGINWGTGKSEPMTQKVKFGLSHQVRENIIYVVDLETEGSSKPWLMHGGCEWSVTKALLLRGGLTQEALPGSTTTNITLGIGLKVGKVTFDYGYKIDALVTEANLGYFSITYDFGEKQRRTQIETEKDRDEKLEKDKDKSGEEEKELQPEVEYKAI